MSMLDSFCTSHVLSLRDDASKLLVSEAIFRKLKYNVSESVKRDASIGIFHSETLGIMPSVVQALDNTSLYRLLKCHYGVTETDIGNFISNISVSTAKDFILSSYRIYSISFPYKDYLNFIGYKLSDIALNELGIEKKRPLGVLYSLLEMEYQEILSEVALAVNAYYAIKPVAKELCISEDEAKQKILYFISNQNNISIFKEYYRNILGETRSVPSTSACKVIRPYLYIEEE